MEQPRLKDIDYDWLSKQTLIGNSNPEIRHSIRMSVADEQNAQDKKWGANRLLDDGTWLKILVEEVGEAATASLENDHENLEEELVQVAAVANAWLECLVARKIYNHLGVDPKRYTKAT